MDWTSYASRKFVLTVLAIIVIMIATIFITDMERLKWFVSVLVGLIASFNIGQGIADSKEGVKK